jgi:hypothetical protein
MWGYMKVFKYNSLGFNFYLVLLSIEFCISLALHLFTYIFVIFIGISTAHKFEYRYIYMLIITFMVSLLTLKIYKRDKKVFDKIKKFKYRHTYLLRKK